MIGALPQIPPRVFAPWIPTKNPFEKGFLELLKLSGMVFMKTDKIKKELLTKEKVKYDLSVNTQNTQKGLIVVSVLLLIGVVLLGIYIVSQALNESFTRTSVIRLIVRCLFALVVLIAFAGIICHLLRLKYSIKHDAFKIVQDTLVDVGESRYKYEKPMKFSRYGEFYPPRWKSYQWSESYRMSDTGIRNTALVGDTFYLVIFDFDKKQKPVVVYNERLFEWNEE